MQYDAKIVLEALILTAGIFVFLSLFACQTKYDFTSWIPYMGTVLWGLILFGFLYIWFPHTSTSELIYGLVIAVVFSGYILIDTQLILRHYHPEEEIAAAVSLPASVICLPISMLTQSADQLVP